MGCRSKYIAAPYTYFEYYLSQLPPLSAPSFDLSVPSSPPSHTPQHSPNAPSLPGAPQLRKTHAVDPETPSPSPAPQRAVALPHMQTARRVGGRGREFGLLE